MRDYVSIFNCSFITCCHQFKKQNKFPITRLLTSVQCLAELEEKERNKQLAIKEKERRKQQREIKQKQKEEMLKEKKKLREENARKKAEEKLRKA